ncbi:MAG TPA: hypothetical protein P5572_16895 [Phycisphaerae bacterium]|nr:hypothetical protein [Phycisphaerales bacterium]HRX86704.1 hypothetical protein [Phycisphaerae bacterium]
MVVTDWTTGKSRKSIGGWAGLLAAALLLSALPAAAFAAEQPPTADPVADEPPPPPDDALGPPGRGMDRHRGPRAGVMLWRRMTDDERTALKQFIADEYPEMYDRLLETQANDDDMFERWIGRILPDMIHMKELKDRDPQLFQVRKSEQQTEMELRRLARRYRFATTDEDRAALAEQIRPLVGKQFDIRQRRMGEEIDRLEQRVGQLRARLQKQADDRDAEIEKMYQRILEGNLGPPDDEDGEPGRHERLRRGRRGNGPPRDGRPVPEPEGQQ